MNSKTILILLISIILFSCSTEKTAEQVSFFSGIENNPGEKAIITGVIHNFDVYSHVKLMEIKLIDFDGAETVYSSPFGEDGKFYFEFFPYTTREVSFYPVEERIIISPGDSLYIEKDLKDIGKTIFSGKNGELNKNISQFRSQYLGRYNAPATYSFSEFRKKCDKTFNENQQKLVDFRKKNKISELFDKWADKQLGLDYYYALFRFPFQHFLATKEQLSKKEKELYYEFVKEFEKKMDNSLLMADYFEIIEEYGKFITNPDFSDFFRKNLKAPEPNDMINKFKSASHNKYLSQFLLSDYINGAFLKANKTDWIDENQELLNQLITDSFLRFSLDNRYNAVKSYNEDPRIYSDEVLGNNFIEIKGAGTKISDKNNVIKHIIDSNPGTILYIDLWAPWCSACVDLLPYSRDLNKYFEGKPVLFVYVSIGSTEEKWKSIIDEYELKGIHHLCSPDEASDVMKRFKTNSIPYYVLIDKEGVMVDFGRHLRPSGEDIKLAIEKLLEK